MILVHVMDMPRLLSGRDNQGRPWTVIALPATFARHLGTLSEGSRASVQRGLYEDFRRTVPEEQW